MSKTKTVDYTGVKSKPLPRLPMVKKKSSAGITMTTLKSSYASTPSKFYVSEQDSFVSNGESPTLLARSAQGIHGLNSKSTSFGHRPSDSQRQHERPGRSLRISVGPGSGGGGVGVTAHYQPGDRRGKEGNTVEIYTPESDIRTPHLISKNTITYHSNFFERPHLEEGEEGAGGRSNDPLEIEELEVELRSPSAVDPPTFAFGSDVEPGPATSTPVVGRGAFSPDDLDSAASSDFYQHHQYQQQLQQLHNQPHPQSPPPPSVPPAPLTLPSHRNRSQRSYDAHPTSPGGQSRGGGGGGSFSRGRPKPVGLEYFEIEGSWAFDTSGKAYFRGTGKIEEVRDDDQEKMQEDQMTPKIKSSLGSTGLDSQNRLTFHTPPQEPLEVTSPLPPTTSPPPRPKRVEEAVLSPGGTNFSIPKTLLDATPGLSEIGIARANGSFSGHGFGHIHRHRVGLGVQLDVPMDLDVPFARSNTLPAPPLAALPAPPAPAPSETEIQQESQELDLETQSLLQMLKHVDNGVKDIVALRDYFIRTCAVYSILRKHIDVTYRVEAALLEVQEAIDRRRSIPQSHLDIRTAEWQEKFELRLVSFRTTTQRLTALREFVEKRKKLTEQHLEELFQRLLAHEMKYTDIASKLHASYDRLKLHHLHTRLEVAYKAEVEAHKERRARKRKSYLRKRAEVRLERNAGAGAGLRERGPATT